MAADDAMIEEDVYDPEPALGRRGGAMPAIRVDLERRVEAGLFTAPPATYEPSPGSAAASGPADANQLTSVAPQPEAGEKRHRTARVVGCTEQPATVRTSSQEGFLDHNAHDCSPTQTQPSFQQPHPNCKKVAASADKKRKYNSVHFQLQQGH